MHERLQGQAHRPHWQMATRGQPRHQLPPWGRPSGRSSSTSRRWPSPARPATATAKRAPWATWATSTRPGQTEQAIEHHQQALAIARETGDRDGEGAPGQPRQQLCRLGADRAGDRALPAGPGHRPRDRQPRRRRRVAWAVSATASRPGADRAGDRALTSRPWPSPARPATATAKARPGRSRLNAMRTWGRPSGRSSTTSRPWPSPARPATATAKVSG